jgi:dipeptidyl aminopeptidase/acylaminoacyl peptidase
VSLRVIREARFSFAQRTLVKMNHRSRFRAPRTALCLAALVLAACGGEPRRADGARADTLSLAERRRIPGTIAYVAERDGNKEVYVVRPSGEGERRLTRTLLDSYITTIAPDGSGVLGIEVEEAGGNRYEQLVFHPVPRGTARPVGGRHPYSRSAAWSADGEWIVFESAQASFRDLYRIRLDGTGEQRLTDNREGNFEPVISPDGAWVAFGSSRDQNAEIYRMRLDGSEETRLTTVPRHDDFFPQWSPDGTHLAFASTRDGDERIFVMRADGGGQRRLTRPDTISDIAEQQPGWSPDGRRIAYIVRQRGRGSRVRITEVASGATREVPGGSEGGESEPQWSADGRYLAFASSRDGDHEIYLARADGSRATRLTHAPADDWHPRWIPARRAGAADSTRTAP